MLRLHLHAVSLRMPWISSLIKASPTICLVRSGNEPTIQLIPLSLLSLPPPPREKKCTCSIGNLFTSRPNSIIFSLLSPHQIICYGFSVVEIFGSSLRRSLNINASLKIKITPQLDGENVVNTLESIVASRVEPSNMYLWYLTRALKISQSYFLWSELLQWYLKMHWIFTNVSFSYCSWWPKSWGLLKIYCHLQYYLTLFDRALVMNVN